MEWHVSVEFGFLQLPQERGYLDDRFPSALGHLDSHPSSNATTRLLAGSFAETRQLSSQQHIKH